MEPSEIIRDELSQIIQRTRDTALADGTISADEAVLIDLLEDQLNEINDEIQPIVDLMADLTEPEIRSRVKIVSREIVPKLTILAKKDSVISADEAAILDTITKMIVRQS